MTPVANIRKMPNAVFDDGTVNIGPILAYAPLFPLVDYFLPIKLGQLTT